MLDSFFVSFREEHNNHGETHDETECTENAYNGKNGVSGESCIINGPVNRHCNYQCPFEIGIFSVKI